MYKPEFDKNKIETLHDARFVKLYDLNYAEGKHYFNATRRSVEDLVCLKNDEEFKTMLPDAVTCIVILKEKGKEPKLLLSYEYRYPTGQFLLSPPAGLIDKDDAETGNPLLSASIREIKEETGLSIKDSDCLKVVSPLSFSTPGMTDESNALVSAVIEVDDLSGLDQSGAIGGELFNGFKLVDRKEALSILKEGRDEYGNFFSIYTWAALMYFVSDMWRADND